MMFILEGIINFALHTFNKSNNYCATILSLCIVRSLDKYPLLTQMSYFTVTSKTQ